jgi:hypothetical protein
MTFSVGGWCYAIIWQQHFHEPLAAAGSLPDNQAALQLPADSISSTAIVAHY